MHAKYEIFLGAVFWIGSVGLCSKNGVLCFRVSPVKPGYYVQKLCSTGGMMLKLKEMLDNNFTLDEQVKDRQL